MTLIAIQSARFPHAFLRMDGSNVTQSEGGGSGTVNCQFYEQGSIPTPTIGNLEVFELVSLGELSTGQGYGIRSFHFPNAYLRMDGSNVTQFNGAGSGTVNCQYYAYGSVPQNNSPDYEHFIRGTAVLETLSHGIYYTIISGTFYGAFLRIDGTNVTRFNAAGSGTVNCQSYPLSRSFSGQEFELFNIISL